MARRKDRYAFDPPVCLPGRPKSCPHRRRLKWVRRMHSKLIALLDNPLMIFHYCALKRQVSYIFGCQPESPTVAEATSIGDQGGRPECLWYNRILIFLRPRQLRKQPLATVHDELKLLDNRRLISEDLC